MADIYGVSSKFEFGKWDHCVYRFKNADAAQEWLNSEEYDFREREVMTKDEAIKLAGEETVMEAIDR